MLAGAGFLSENPVMVRDPVSEVLDVVEARCVITGGLRAGGEWSLGSRPEAPVKIDAVVSGSCWLIADDQAPVRLGPGDAAVLCGVNATVLCSDPSLARGAAQEPHQKLGLFSRVGVSEPDVVIIGGHVDLDPMSADLFTTALPPVLHAAADDAEAGEMRRLLERIVEESESDRAGAGFAADQYAQLLLLEVLRAGMRHGAAVPPGWLRLLMDSRLRPAVRLMHADPSRGWRLPELAAAASMSRSHFARQFQQVSGQPPLTYLAHWRIRLAQRALRTSDTTIAALAERLGYASESTFSHAFTRIACIPPARYRQNHRRSVAAQPR
ncbi:AraC family transcriptional regulator [Actinomadura napierensis]|uniref:AraC family transcriptional regulator n=2 Tax=Actinomadura napierensis TaxID=267854 RepID=A0ABN2Y0B1_9ACTN